MDQFFASAPRWVIATIAIVVGFLLIIAFNPPASVCDSQLDIFHQAQRAFLYPSKQKEIDKPPMIKTLFAECQQDNSPGGCFELFDRLKKLSIDLGNIPRECSEKAGEDPAVKEWLKKSLKLLVELAWGDKGPVSFAERQGWLDSSDVALFCSLRSRMIQLYGNGAFTEWRESVLNGLPMASKMDREQRWQKSLLSTQCDVFR